ncbi:MAG: hypothetical protein ACR2FM_02240 [Candidatus Saccharimonadales bacterium]
MSGMNLRKSEEGQVNLLVIPLIISGILLLFSIGFGAWAFIGQQDYKKNFDEKVAGEVTVAVDKAKTEKDNEFFEREKNPLKNYTSSAQFGTLSFQYPKTWSAYESEENNQLKLLMQPNLISANPAAAQSLRVEVINTAYDQAVSQLDSLIKQGKVKVVTYSLPKLPSVVGLRIDGQIEDKKTGATVFLPLRDKTIKISVESSDRINDFNTIILPSFTFIP